MQHLQHCEKAVKVIERIQENAPSLTPSEKRLVEAIYGDPQTAALSTAADIAKAADVHEATVSRLVRKLGYEHYAGFRSALQSEFIATQEPALRLQNTLQNSQTPFVQLLIEQERAALLRMEELVDGALVGQTADRLMAARRLYFYGRGNAEVLALLMYRRFRRFGKDCRRLSGDGRDLAEQLLGLSQNDAVLLFSFRRPPPVYAALLATIQEAGATSVVIAGASGALLTPPPDILFGIPRGSDHTRFQTLTVPMTLCNAIVLAAAAQHQDVSLPMLERLGALIERFET